MISSTSSNLSSISESSETMYGGVKLSSRPSTTYSERNGRITETRLSHNVIQEEPWSLKDMLGRNHFLRTDKWFSSQPAHTVLAALRVPQDFLSTSIASTPFERFMYWRGDVELEFQVTSTPLSQGMLAAVFVPLSERRFIDSTIIPNFSSLSVNQTVYLYANTNTCAKMHISFNSPSSYLDLTEEIATTRNSLGYVYLVVFNPIELAATASDTSSVSMFSRFINSEFKVPRISNVSSRFSATPQASAMLTTALSALTSKPNGPPSSGSKSILSSIASKLIPSSLVGDAIDGVLGVFGLDKPTDPNLSLPNVILGNQRMNFAQGIEYIDKLTVFPAQTYESTFETFATTIDEMSLKFLVAKYSYLGSFSFSTTSVTGDVIASWPINPIPSELTNMRISQVPLLSYLSFPFQFWRGSLTYKLQVVSTSFQTGKIFIAYNFGSYKPGTSLSLGQLTSQYGEAYEINQGSNELEFSVPYVASTPYLDVPNSNVPSVEDSVGYINITILNPLVAPNNTPLSITLNVFVAGGDDFELSTLTTANNVVPVQPIQLSEEWLDVPGPQQKTWTASPQSAVAPMVTPTNEVDISAESLVAPNASTQDRIETTQIIPPSLKDLLSKYQSLPVISYQIPAAGTGGYIGSIPIRTFFGGQNLGTSPIPPGTGYPILGLWTHLTSLYRQFKGPLRFKIMVDGLTPNYSFAVFYQPPVRDSSGTFNPTLNFNSSIFMPAGPTPALWNGVAVHTRVSNLTRLPLTYVNGISKTAEFEIPFSSKFGSILNWMGSASENELANSPLTDLGMFVFYGSPIDEIIQESAINVRMFMSLGDESRFGNLFQIPYIAVNNAVNADGTFYSNCWPDGYPDSPASNTLFRL